MTQFSILLHFPFVWRNLSKTLLRYRNESYEDNFKQNIIMEMKQNWNDLWKLQNFIIWLNRQKKILNWLRYESIERKWYILKILKKNLVFTAMLIAFDNSIKKRILISNKKKERKNFTVNWFCVLIYSMYNS